jgi:diadenosine tetraphosphate (Ap4A) HIT family hydrolase
MTAIHRIVEACRAGAEPALVASMGSGWVVMGQRQVLAGYCLLLPDPVVPHLNALAPAERDRFMADLGRVGDVVQAVTGALRINYAIFGNLEPALHAHVIPRYRNEPEAVRTQHPWSYDWSRAPAFDAVVAAPLMRALRAELEQLGVIHAP